MPRPNSKGALALAHSLARKHYRRAGEHTKRTQKSTDDLAALDIFSFAGANFSVRCGLVMEEASSFLGSLALGDALSGLGLGGASGGLASMGLGGGKQLVDKADIDAERYADDDLSEGDIAEDEELEASMSKRRNPPQMVTKLKGEDDDYDEEEADEAPASKVTAMEVDVEATPAEEELEEEDSSTLR